MPKRKNLTNKELTKLVENWKKYNSEGNFRAREKVSRELISALENFFWMMIRRAMPHWPEEKTEEVYQDVLEKFFSKVIQKYDPNVARLTTYSGLWVRHCINRYMAKNCLVQVPLNKHASAIYKKYKGEEMTEEEQSHAPSFIYWDVCVGEDDNMPLSEAMSSEYDRFDSPKAVEILEKKREAELVEKLIIAGTKDKKEEIILRGILAEKSMSSIGKELGLCRERVRQIREKCFAKMRKLAANDKTLSWG